MFTDEQLKQLRQIIREEVEAEAEKTRTAGAFERIQLRKGLEDVGDSLKSVDVEIRNSRKEFAAFKEEAATNFKKQGKDITAIKKTQNTLLDMLDLEQTRQSKKIARLEQHLDLEPLKFAPGTANPV